SAGAGTAVRWTAIVPFTVASAPYLWDRTRAASANCARAALSPKNASSTSAHPSASAGSTNHAAPSHNSRNVGVSANTSAMPACGEHGAPATSRNLTWRPAAVMHHRYRSIHVVRLFEHCRETVAWRDHRVGVNQSLRHAVCAPGKVERHGAAAHGMPPGGDAG